MSAMSYKGRRNLGRLPVALVFSVCYLSWTLVDTSLLYTLVASFMFAQVTLLLY